MKTPFVAVNEKWIPARRTWRREVVLAGFTEVTVLPPGALEALTEHEWARVGPTIVGDDPYVDS